MTFDWLDNIQLYLLSTFTLKLNNIEKLFGYQNNTSFANSFNTILLLIRYYIFGKSKNQGSLFTVEFKRLLKRVYVEQELLSKLENKNHMFIKNWARFKNYIGQI